MLHLLNNDSTLLVFMNLIRNLAYLCCDITDRSTMFMQPSYVTDLANLSVRPFVLYGLLTQKQRGHKKTTFSGVGITSVPIFSSEF